MKHDTLSTLLFSNAGCRAQIVRLEHAWEKIVAHHDLPKPVQQLLGELVAASVLLSASLKFNGSLIIQLQGDGPVKLMVAECNNHLGIRATVKLSPKHKISDAHTFKQLVNQHNKGLCVLVLDPHNRQPGQQPYQGVVSLEGNNMAQALEAYMSHSEQLNTKIHLVSSAHTVAGLLIQQMPEHGGKTHKKNTVDPDGWNTVIALTETIQTDELLQLAPQEVAYRLYHELEPEVLAERTPKFECTCSRSKVSNMLLRLGEPEIKEALREQNHLDIHCEFCNAAYHFTEAQCLKLFEQHDLEDFDAVGKKTRTLH